MNLLVLRFFYQFWSIIYVQKKWIQCILTINLPMKLMCLNQVTTWNIKLDISSISKSFHLTLSVPQCLHYPEPPQKTIVHLSVIVNYLYFFRIVYEANCIVSTLCAWLNYFETDCCFVIQYFIPFYQWVVFHFMHLQTFFTHSSVDEHWIITKFLLLWIKVPWIFL